MKNTNRKPYKKSKLFLTFGLIIMFFLILSLVLIMLNNINSKNIANKIEEISSHYNNVVITNKKSNIYIKGNNDYTNIGSVEKGILLSLKEDNITDNTNYFAITNMDDEYYINYQDVDKSDDEIVIDDRYKNYIPFNENVTSSKINLYKDNNLVYSLNKKLSLPIYIKEDDKYYVEYMKQLFEVKKAEVEVVDNNNSNKTNTKGIGVLNYHFFWDDKTEEKSSCNQEICYSKSQFKIHLDYIKNNNIFTPTMHELEQYIDGKIQLPKSVVITIDDGWRAKLGIEMLNEYELNGTLFLITGSYDSKNYVSKYVEVHSHTDNLHDSGKCPGGQGGGIKCLPKEEILDDLKTSRAKLNNSTVLCYPFYEYNDYSIQLAKEAGFTMAFAGENSNSDNLVKVGSDKFRLPRFVIVNYTTMTDFINYID